MKSLVKIVLYMPHQIYDIFEIEDIIKHDGPNKGSVIRFYDYQTGKVYLTFKQKENIGYGR